MTDLEKQYEKVKTELEQLKVEIEKQKNSNGDKWKRAGGNAYYYYIGSDSTTLLDEECHTCVGDIRHYIANYCTDEATMKRIAETQNLMRELERFRDEHESEKVDWNDGEQRKYYIYYDYAEDKFGVFSNGFLQNFADVYFATKECAEQAIEVFGERIKAVMVC